MFLHVGNNKNIREKNIKGNLDMDNATVSPISRKFLSTAQKRGQVESAIEEIPKSFLLYEENNECKICFSQLSSSALKGRMSS